MVAEGLETLHGPLAPEEREVALESPVHELATAAGRYELVQASLDRVVQNQVDPSAHSITPFHL